MRPLYATYFGLAIVAVMVASSIYPLPRKATMPDVPTSPLPTAPPKAVVHAAAAPAAPGAPLSTEVPQAVIDALNTVQAAQDQLHAANGTKAGTATALTQAQTADQAAAAAVASALAGQQQAFSSLQSVMQSVYANPAP